MQNPETVLDNLASQSESANWKYRRIYRNLYNKEFYMLEYSNIYSKPGNMKKRTDDKTIDGINMERIDNIIISLKDKTYQPEPARRVYISKGAEGKDY